MLFSLSLELNTDSVTENLEIEVINGKFSVRNFKIFFSLAKKKSSTQIFLVNAHMYVNNSFLL